MGMTVVGRVELRLGHEVQELAAEDRVQKTEAAERGEGVGGDAGQDRGSIGLFELGVDERPPGELECGEEELHSRPHDVADVVEPARGQGREDLDELAVREVQDLVREAVGNFGKAEGGRAGEHRPGKAPGQVPEERREERQHEEKGGGGIGQENPGDAPSAHHQPELQSDVEEAPEEGHDAECPRASLDPEEIHGDEREGIEESVGGDQEDPGRHLGFADFIAEEEAAQRRGEDRAGREERRADGESRHDERRRQDLAIELGIQLVVDTKKTRVEPHPEEDLREDAEQEQDPESPVVFSREVRREDGEKEEVDEVGKDVRGPVDGGVMSEPL